MKNIFLTAILFLSVKLLIAQANKESKNAEERNEAYRAYREKITTPPYGLQKIKSLISHIKRDDEDNESLDEKKYLALSLREKFTYNMIHPESFSQNCDGAPNITNEQKKIFAHLPDAFGEYNWSEKQDSFFLDNKDSVIEWIKASILRTNRVGLNYKYIIVSVNAKEMIPLLINTYKKDRKDHDILTVLMLLMQKNEYADFMSSQSFRKLYFDDSNYWAYINYNSANEALIIQRATDFISK
ncbi:MAG TPA: hypothetical protein VKT28_02820 [Puia sp.]|nr:hypothetical protein [Puia sp.]